MGSPSPSATRLKRDSSITRAGPHRRTLSVTSSCVSLELGDQDLLYSPARSTGPGKSHVAKSTASSPRTPAGVSPGEKSASPASVKKRRSSIGGLDDLARGLDFSNSSSPLTEEKKLHSFLTKGGGHKKVAQPPSPIAQASSSGKKTGVTTPPGKEKLVAGRALTSVLSPKKLIDGRELSKKDVSSPRKPSPASGGSSNMNGGTTANSELGKNSGRITPRRSSPLRASLDGKIGKLSSPRLITKSKSELGFTKGRTSSSGDLAALDSFVEAEINKFSPKVTLDGKITKKSFPSPSLKSKPSLTSSPGSKLTKNRQDSTPSPPQPGRIRTRNDKAAHNVELSRPELESIEVPVYSEYEYEREAKSDHVVNLSHKMLLQHGEADEEGSTLLASLMVSGNVGDEDMSSLKQGVEPGFDNDTELPTSWLSEDLPCMFSSLSRLPEPDDLDSSSLLGDPPEILDEPFQISSNEHLLAVRNDTNGAEISRSIEVSSAKSAVSTMDEKFAAVEDKGEVSNGVHQPAMDEDSAWNYESNSFCNMTDDQVDKFEAELRTQIDATYELDSPQLSVPQVEHPVDKFEAELRTQIDTTFESPQLSVPPVGQQYVVPVDIAKSMVTLDKGETMPYTLTTHHEDIASSASDNEDSVSDSIGNEDFLQGCPSHVTEKMQTGEGQSQLISSQIVKDPSQGAPMSFLESDSDFFQLDSTSFAKNSISVPDAEPPSLHDEGRWPLVEEEISTSHSRLDQDEIESSDGKLEHTIEESDSAQLNLKQSFDEVAESLEDSRSRVDELDANVVSTAPIMVSPREDTYNNGLEQYAIGLQELALSTESEFAPEFLDGQDCGAITPTYLDQDMKIFEEYWTQSMADEFSQSDAGQNDAEDPQLSAMSVEAQMPNTVEEEAEKSLPPIELPISGLPVFGKLKLAVVESKNLEPPGQAHAEVGETKIEIMDVNEEISAREAWPCPDSAVSSLPASENYQVDTESVNQEEIEEFDEVFHLYGGSEELSTSAILFDNLSSPSRPNVLPEDIIKESLHTTLSESPVETRFENVGDSDSSGSPRHTTPTLGIQYPHVASCTQAAQLNLQNRDVEEVMEHQDFSIKNLAAHDTSVDNLLHDPCHDSISGTVDGQADQKPNHEDLGTPPVLAMSSNDFNGVNDQDLDDDDASDDRSNTNEYLHQGGPDMPNINPDLSLASTIQDISQTSFFETPAMAESHIDVHSNGIFESSQGNPIKLQGLDFSASCDQTAGGGGDRNLALTDDDQSVMLDDCILKINNSQSSPDRHLSGPIVQVAAETDASHELDLKTSPKLPKVEDGQTLLVSPQSSDSAVIATKEVDPLQSNALFPHAGGINDKEHLTEASNTSCLVKEEESFYGELHSEDRTDRTISLVGRQEWIESSILGPTLQRNFDQEKHQGLYSSEEGAESMNNYSGCVPTDELVFNSTELKDNFQNMSATSGEIDSEVPGQDSSQIHGDGDFQDDERFPSSALQNVVESHTDVNMSDVDQKPQILQLTSSRGSETLKEYSAINENSDYSTAAALDKSLRIGVSDERNTDVLSVACIPLFNEEDDLLPDKFDAKPEVNSTASLDIVIPGTEVPNYTDKTASSTDIVGKDEVTHVVGAAPVVVSAKELPNTTLNEVNVFDRYESECEVNEQISLHEDHSKSGVVSLGEQSKVELDWETPLMKVDSSGSKSSAKDQQDPLHEESMFTNVSHGRVNPCSPAEDSNIADARGDIIEDLVIDRAVSEEASSIISTSASTPSELTEYHGPNLQATQLPLEIFISSVDQISRTEDATEVEKALMTPSDAKFDEDLPEAELHGHAVNDVETNSGNSTSQSFPSKVFVTPSEDTANADAEIMKEDPDFSWKSDNEGECLNGIPRQNLLPEDVDTVVDDVEKSFILSDQDPTINADDDHREEDSSLSGMTVRRDNMYLNGRHEEEPLLVDEEMVVSSPKDSYGYVSDPDTEIMVANDIRNPSSISWTTDEDEDGLNENVEEESLLECKNTEMYSPKDTSDSKISGTNGIQNDSIGSWKADSEKDYMNENSEEDAFLKDEDMTVESTKDSFVVLGQNSAILDVDEMEEQSNSSWISSPGNNREILNGSLERDELEDETKGVPNLQDPFNILVQETPCTTTLDVSDIPNHSNISWMADSDELESFKGSREEEFLLEDEDTVVYSPMESVVTSDQDDLDTPHLVDDKMEALKFSEKVDKEVKNLNGSGIEEDLVPEVEEAMPEVDEVMPVAEAAMPEAQETMVDNHEDALAASGIANAETLMVEDAEKQETLRDDNEDEENLIENNLEKESIGKVQEVVDNRPTSESSIALDVLNANADSLDVEKEEKRSAWRTVVEGETLNRSIQEKSMFEVEEKEVNSLVESSVVSEEGNSNAAISAVDELEKYSTWRTDKEREHSNRNLEEESVLEVQKTEKDCSNGTVNNVLVCQVPEGNGSLQINSDYMGEDLVCHSKIEDGTMTLHGSEKDAVDNSTRAVKAENPRVVNTDLVDEDSNHQGQLVMASAVVDCKNVIPEKTNGNHYKESESPHETNPVIETPVLEKETWTSGLESNSQDIDSLEESTEPRSPDASSSPPPASEPPFSGSKQDHLWEEQAEAYSSGGRGTPSRSEEATQAAAPFRPPSSPGEQPSSSDDQIQPAYGPMNNGHTVAGPSNVRASENGIALHEPKGKGKLHTPLRSLLLEDANKSTDGDPRTPNALTSSPSFIRRLFRVMSTPSRAADRESSQTKLKKSSSMWVSCLGSPHVKQ
ncbi:hypothetical protein M758_3G178400 [Ceratodon purpureus]|nr:hypothetical protein M758_3G178400 [Ceratodon purpureus]